MPPETPINRDPVHAIRPPRRRWGRTFLLVCALCTLLSLLLVWPDASTLEPEYNGKSLSDWVVVLHSAPEGRAYYDSLAAIRATGTNAVPHLLRMLRFEPSWHHTLLAVALPRLLNVLTLRNSPIIDRKLADRDGAVFAFEVLGSRASNAIPALGSWLAQPELGDSKTVLKQFNDTVTEIQKILKNRPMPAIGPTPEAPIVPTSRLGPGTGAVTPLPSPSPAPGPRPSPASDNLPTHQYVVQTGDTLGAIGARLNKQGIKVTRKQIADANPQIKDWQRIHPGDKINIPEPAAPARK